MLVLFSESESDIPFQIEPLTFSPVLTTSSIMIDIVHENDCITVGLQALHCMINYEDLYFHVITLCSLDVKVNFLGK